MEFEEIIMNLIMYGGDARSQSLMAIQTARQNNFEEAYELLGSADDAINKAHAIQTDLVQAEIRGEKTEVCLLMIHAQDHLMNAMTVRDLAQEIVEILKNKK